MKRILVLIIFIVYFFSTFETAYAQGTGWDIESLDSEISILENGKVSINEIIVANFNSIEHHGIYRDLVYKKDSADNEKHYLSYQIKEVFMDDSPVQYTTSYTDEFFRIQIGDPSKTLTDKHVYKIKYTAIGAIGSFSDHDELYWNVTGNYWSIPVLNSTAKVILPKEGIERVSCFKGTSGSANSCESSKDSDVAATFKSDQELNPGEGLTLVVGFTKGLVPILEGKAPPAFGLDPIDIVIFSLINLVSFTLMFYLWWKKGRDSWFKRKFLYDPGAVEEVKPIGGHDTIVVEFDPPGNLRPAEIGQVLFEDFRAVSLTATVVDLAVRGYLKIQEEETGFILKTKDYTFIKQNKNWETLLPFEKILLEAIFGNVDQVKLSSLIKTLHISIKEVKKTLDQDMVEKKFFKENPGKIKSHYVGTGACLLVIPIIFLSTPLKDTFQHELAFLLALITSGIVVMVFGLFMSARTALGHEMKNKILGYKLFISRAERYRQQFFERQNMFNEILPYAILFGQTQKFAKAFADLGMQPSQTNWYVGAAVFNAATFSNDMSSFAGAFNSSMSSSSGFSGGGGSGGGGGGGGGGGW